MEFDRLEFRAPGLTQVRLSGRLAVAADGVAFSGPTEIDASDPKTLAGWLEGRNETAPGERRPLSLRGDVTLASDRVAVEHLKVELDRKPATGRLAYIFASGTQPARLDVEVKAAQFDIDAALDFGRALLAGSAVTRPREITLAADIGRATVAGIDARDVSARLKVDGGGLQIDRLSVADYGGGSVAASGRVDTDRGSPRGTLSVDFDARQTAAIERSSGSLLRRPRALLQASWIASGTRSCTERSISPARQDCDRGRHSGYGRSCRCAGGHTFACHRQLAQTFCGGRSI